MESEATCKMEYSMDHKALLADCKNSSIPVRAQRTQLAALALVRSLLLVMFLGCGTLPARAGRITPVSNKDVTIVYNVDEKEFVCWFEGPPRARPAAEIASDTGVPVCPFANSHRYRDNIYFYRGQTVSILLVGAKAGDIYTADLKVDNLEQPTIPVFGGVTELPSLQAIQPAEQLVLATGTKQAAGAEPLATELLVAVDRFQSADFQNLVKQKILDPASKPEIQQLATGVVSRAVSGMHLLLDSSGTLVQNATLACQNVAATRSSLATLRQNHCVNEAAGDPRDFDTYLILVKKLSQLIERQKALKAQIDASGLSGQAKDFTTLVSVSNSSSVQTALLPDFKGMHALLDSFYIEFGGQPLAVIDGMKPNKAKTAYVRKDDSTAQQGFLAQLNRMVKKVDDKSLATLKTNLSYIALNFSPIQASVTQLSNAQDAIAELTTSLGTPAAANCAVPAAGAPALTLIAFQAILSKTAIDTIDAADAANCSAQYIPLPNAIIRPVVDQWYGNKQITLTLSKSTRVPLFDVTGFTPPNLTSSQSSSPSSSTSSDSSSTKKGGSSDSQKKGSGQSQSANSGSTTSSDGSKQDKSSSNQQSSSSSQSSTVARQTSFRIHDVYRYELGFGFMRSDVKDQKFQLVQQTTTTNGATSTSSQFFVQSRNRSYHFLPTADLLIYPIKRDYFPWKPRFEGEKPAQWWTKLGGLLGFSLSSPTSDFFFGGTYMPSAGIGLKTGIHLSYVDALPKGVQLGVPITAVSTAVEQRLEHGYFVGVEFNAQLFKDTLGIILKKK
jgi:hypothetical protein